MRARDNITGWTPRLRAAIDLALSQHPKKVPIMHLICNTKGQKITESAFDSAWQRFRKAMDKAGIEPFKFHDLKAKGASDFDGSIMDAGGWKTEAMAAVYNRKKKVVRATR